MGTSVRSIRSGSKTPIGGRAKRKVASPIDKAKAYEVVWQQVAPLFEAARPLGEDASFVYFIGEVDDGPLKIGVSKDPVSRLRGMQTGNPRRLRIEYVLLGFRETEKLLHEFWEPQAVFSARNEGRQDVAPGTEWFKPEVREKLLPIIATAAEEQAKFALERLVEPFEPLRSDEMERIVRDSHYFHGFVPEVRDEVWLLAQGLGYVRARGTRGTRL